MNTNKTTLTITERTAITRQLLTKDVLRGIDRTKTKGQALNIIGDCLNKCGFELGLVSGDIILGDRGQRILPFNRANCDNSIENSGIVFVWEKTGNNSMEFIVYLS